jgi:putative glutamine amidotransferase
MTYRPIVAVTTWRRRLDTYLGAETDLYTLGAEYADAVSVAGGVPLLVPNLAPEVIGGVLDRVDALLLSGGEDVDPAYYGAAAAAGDGDHDAGRDATEGALVRGAMRRSLPTLGICRGMQLANVALGGTLVLDLPQTPAHPVVCGPEATRGLRHGVRVDADWLRDSLSGLAGVNSIHHQAVDQVAPPLRAVAWADDGVVEAVEGADGAWYFRGVQWHPEKMDIWHESRHSVTLFADFLRAAHHYAAVRGRVVENAATPDPG